MEGRLILKDSIHKINIAIDGPAGAGKSTIARFVAKELGYIYIDTGAMYRAVTLKMLQAGLKLTQMNQIIELTSKLNIELISKQDGQLVFVNDEDVTNQIRSQEVNQYVSELAQVKEVRKLLVKEQKKLANSKGVVMDGRDIGTHVLPDAEIKIYLTASVEERARRRYQESNTSEVTLKQIEHEISSRDEADKHRDISPLIVALDAHVIDCTYMSIAEVVQTIIKRCRTKTGGEQ